jgi:hypothetical protein
LPGEAADDDRLGAELRASARRRDRTLVAVTLLALGVLWLALGAEPVIAGLAVAAGAATYLLVRR